MNNGFNIGGEKEIAVDGASGLCNAMISRNMETELSAGYQGHHLRRRSMLRKVGEYMKISVLYSGHIRSKKDELDECKASSIINERPVPRYLHTFQPASIPPDKLLFTAVVFFWFAQYVYIPFQTPYLNSIGTGADMIGLIVGAYGISQMVLRLPVGVLADRQNRHKQLIILGGASSGLASVFRAIMGNETGFLIGNLFSGLASAMWISFMVLYMSFYPEDGQRKAAGRLILANNLGMLMGFVVSTLTYEMVGMRIICLSSVISGILCALCALKLPAGTNGTCTVTVREQIRVCKSKNLLVFSLLALIQQGVQMSTTMSFTTQIVESLGARGLMIGISSVIYMMSGVLWAIFASTEKCGRITSKIWICLVFCINGIYCILVPHSQAVWHIWCLQILPGMSTGILFSCLTAEAMKGIPVRFKSTAMGFYQAVFALGMTTFPILCGKIAAMHSMAMAYYFLAAVCVGAAFLSMNRK